MCTRQCWTTRPTNHLKGMPLEWEYADDVDFADEEREPLDSPLQTACTQLRKWNLLVNESKTEFTHIYLSEAAEVSDQGTVARGNETWRNSKSLGSLSAAPKTPCTAVCWVTCHSALFGRCGCEGLELHCKSDFKCTMLCVCPPCCITVAAGLHRRPS